MITTLVQFEFPAGTSVAEAAALFRQSAPEYRAMKGLIRKYCLFGDNAQAVAVCLWEDRESAEAQFDATWRKRFSERYGCDPRVVYCATPIVVDNALGVIQGDAIKTSFGAPHGGHHRGVVEIDT